MTAWNRSAITRPIAELAAQLSERKLSAVELAQGLIERRKAVDPAVRAFNSFDESDALAQARASDERRAAGRALGPLDGIPVGLKDVIAVEGQPLTASSRMLANFVSPYDSTVARRLKEAGALCWGRLNLDEFAMGSSTENSAFGATRNPWDLDAGAGGLVGRKRGRPRRRRGVRGPGLGHGRLDPPARRILRGRRPQADLRAGVALRPDRLRLLARPDRPVRPHGRGRGAGPGRHRRPRSARLDILSRVDIPDYRSEIGRRQGPLDARHPQGVLRGGPRPGDRSRRRGGDPVLPEAGAARSRRSPCPTPGMRIGAYYIIATAECSSNLARYDGIRYGHRSKDANDAVDLYFRSRAEGFGAEVKRRIILGTYVLSSGYHDAYYLRAQKVRTLIRQDFLDAYREVDALITPDLSHCFPSRRAKRRPIRWRCTFATSTRSGSTSRASRESACPAAFPSPACRSGCSSSASPYQEADLLAIAAAYEGAHDWHTRHPDTERRSPPGTRSPGEGLMMQDYEAVIGSRSTCR